MADLIATLITDSGASSSRLGGEAPSVRDDDGVLFGRRDYRVNSHDEGAALSAPGLPAIGEPWSAALPTLRCVRRGPTRYVGGRDGSDGTGGITIVPCEYASPTGRGRLPAPSPSLAYTEIEPGTETVTVYFPVPDPQLVGPPSPHPINNGLGAPVPAPTIRLLVHSFLQASAYTAALLRSLLPLMGRVNANPVSLPSLYTLGGRLDFAPGELLYLHHTPRPAGSGLVEITHTLSAALDHHFRWIAEDQHGRSTGVVVVSQTIPAVDFPTLG